MSERYTCAVRYKFRDQSYTGMAGTYREAMKKAKSGVAAAGRDPETALAVELFEVEIQYVIGRRVVSACNELLASMGARWRDQGGS